MPSVFTIEGVSRARRGRRGRRRKSHGLGRVGQCKTFKNPRTGKTQQTCYVGVGPHSPTGWRIQKSTSSRRR